MEERRKSSRRRTLKRGKVILTKWTVMDCVIRNVSERGARLEFGGPVELPKTFQLQLIDFGRDPCRRTAVAARPDRRRELPEGADRVGDARNRLLALSGTFRLRRAFLDERSRHGERPAFSATPLAEDFDVGDDSDLPGYDQPIAQDDIDAVLNSAAGTVDERRAQLLVMLDDLRGRQEMDESGEYRSLVEQLEAALAELDVPGDGVGTPDAYAFDPADQVL